VVRTHHAARFFLGTNDGTRRQRRTGMASYNKFNIFLFDALSGGHDFRAAGHSIKIYLSNTTPDAETMTIKSNLAEIAAGNGYTAGGKDIANDLQRATFTATVIASDQVWNATPGSMATFQHVVMYNNDTPLKVDPLIAWWSYPSALPMQNGDSFTADFGTEVFHIS
jgi:hypothetical protein